MQAEMAFAETSTGFTKQQRWIIAISVSVLVAIMVGVAFAAGVYIGNNRELALGIAPGFAGGPPPGQGQAGPQRFGQPLAPANQAVPGQPLQQAGPQPGQPNAGGAGRPGFDTLGALAQASGGVLTIATPDGPRQIAVDGQTRYVRDDGQPATFATLRLNSVVGVRLRPGTQTAETVAIITGAVPGPQPAPAGQPPMGQPPRN